MKKIVLSALTVIVFIAAIWIVGTGFRKEPSAFIGEYSFNNNSSALTIHAGVASSAGYIRTVKTKQKETGELQLTFLNAFGGINGNIGAKSVFVIPIQENTSVISIYRDNGFTAVLQKDPETGMWIRI